MLWRGIETVSETSRDTPGDRQVCQESRAAASVPPRLGQLSNGQHLGTTEVRGMSDRRPFQKVRDVVRDVGRRHGLELEVEREGRHPDSLDGAEHHGDELVELGGAKDRVGDVGTLDLVLTGQLLAVVPVWDPIDPDDRGVEEMSCPSDHSKEVPRLLDVGAAEPARVRGGVHNQVRPGGGGSQPFARGQVAHVGPGSGSARKDAHFVAPIAQHREECPAEHAGSAGDEDDAQRVVRACQEQALRSPMDPCPPGGLGTADAFTGLRLLSR